MCDSTGTVASTSCPPGTSDTQQLVLAPDGEWINTYGGLGGLSDEHASVFPPGALGGNSDYVFFLASRTSLNAGTGVIVLSGGSGPDAAGRWTFDFPSADGYGFYPESSGFGQVFLPPLGQTCPDAPGGDVTRQDQTFDLNYAAAGSVVKDPTGLPGSLLMVYEGSNKCAGVSSGSPAGNGAYISDGVATSIDYGHSWPTYRGTSTFDFVPLPGQNTSQGPNASFGATGTGVCMGNDCVGRAPASYGRYAILTPPVPLASLMSAGSTLGDLIGDGEPAAFVDDVASPSSTYLYLIHGFSPGASGFPDGRNSDLTMARAQLHGSSGPLNFLKWDGQSFESAGLGGTEAQILPDSDDYKSCGTLDQSRHMASLYYVNDTQQYLLLFVCDSPSDPKDGVDPAGRATGAAWFFSTSDDLSDPTRWSTPAEVVGSWHSFGSDNSNASNGCPDYNGWYPSLMSLSDEPGHLSLTGYAFSMWGCQGSTPFPGRRYASRTFTISVQ